MSQPAKSPSDTSRITTRGQTAPLGEIPVIYQPIPYTDGDRPAWRIRLELATDSTRVLGFDINGEVMIGRGLKSQTAYIDLDPFEGEHFGVSRRHAMLRPTVNQLFIIDLDSTNGTRRNGHSIGKRTPFSVYNGDLISLGNLDFVVRIVNRPTMGETSTLLRKASLADALAEVAKAITSQLNLDPILTQVAQSALMVISAGEVGIWLVDQQTGELFLEAEWGMHDSHIKRARLPVSGDSLAVQVVKTGKPVRAIRKPGQADPFKPDAALEEGALLFVPITLAGETIGVLSARHRDPGKAFAERDEKVLAAIADFAAIAIQNARTHKVTDDALARRVDELGALNELSHAVSSSLNLNTVHQVLMEQIRRHWEVEAAALWLLDHQTRTVAPFAGTVPVEPSRIGEGIIGKVAATGQPQIVVDADTSADFVASVDTTSGVRTYNMLAVPLFVAGDVVGVLALFNKRDGLFNSQDVERLGTFARPVAAAIENARLFATSEQARAQAEYQHAIVQATLSAFSQPLVIFRDDGEILLANEAAQHILDVSMPQEVERLKQSVGETTEFVSGENTYVATAEQVPYVGTLLVMQDITYVKQLERTRTELMHALSHDLKSPIASIKGWLELIRMVGMASERTPGFIEKIDLSTDRLLEMVGEMLTTARSGAVSGQREPCDLGALTRSALEDLQGAALGKSIRLEFEQRGDPYPIGGDCNHLYRCILNLVDNAIKYCPAETTIWVSLEYQPDALVIKVLDDGPGIPEDDLPHLFEKGYRGVQSEGPEIGTGLGLATVKNIVETHGGKIRARNHPEHGAEFTIILRAVRAGES